MARYYFDLSDGTRERDEAGTELDGIDDAYREAIRFLGEMLKHEPERLAVGTLRVDLHDEHRVAICTIKATIEPA